MSNQINGKVEKILEAETFPSGFTKQTLVVNDGNEKYPQTIPIEFVKDKIELLAGLSVGQDVTVSYDVRGREHNGKYYVNLNGWKIDAGASQTVEPEKAAQSSQVASDEGDEGGSIPF